MHDNATQLTNWRYGTKNSTSEKNHSPVMGFLSDLWKRLPCNRWQVAKQMHAHNDLSPYYNCAAPMAVPPTTISQVPSCCGVTASTAMQMRAFAGVQSRSEAGSCLCPDDVHPAGTRRASSVFIMRKLEPHPVSVLPSAQTVIAVHQPTACLLYTSPSPRDRTRSRMPSSA